MMWVRDHVENTPAYIHGHVHVDAWKHGPKYLGIASACGYTYDTLHNSFNAGGSDLDPVLWLMHKQTMRRLKAKSRFYAMAYSAE